MEEKEAARVIEARIRTIPDYPKPGILFYDITPVLKDNDAFRLCINELKKKTEGKKIDYIVGIEARGFIIGSALAYSLGVGFIPARKKGKLDYYKSIREEYELEYGTATLEMHADALQKGNNVLIVDDLLATGGTASAIANIVKKLGATIVGFLFVIELTGLKGRERLNGSEVISLLKY